MNRLFLASLILLTACATAAAKEPKAAAPVGDPRVVWGVPVPFTALCQFQAFDDGTIRYQRTAATAKMTCPEFSAALAAVQQRFGNGATRIDECVAMDPCFVDAGKAKEPAR